MVLHRGQRRMRLHAQTEVARKMYIESELKLSYLHTHTRSLTDRRSDRHAYKSNA